MVNIKNIVSGGDSYLGLQGSRVRAAGSHLRGKLCKHSKKLRFGSLNLGTIRMGRWLKRWLYQGSIPSLYRRPDGLAVFVIPKIGCSLAKTHVTSGKAAGTSIIVAEMMKAFGVEGAQQISDVIEDSIHFGKITAEFNDSIIIFLHKGKGVIVRQLKERSMPSTRHFLYLEKCTQTCHQMALCELSIEEWLLQLIQSMCENARSRESVGCNPRSVWTLALTKVLPLAPYCSSQFWEPHFPQMSYRIIIESLKELQEKLILWKTHMERKGLRVSMGQTKIVIYRPGLDLQKTPMPCVSGASAQKPYHVMVVQLSFRCEWCTGHARPVDCTPKAEVTMAKENIEVVPSFFYLGDWLSSCGGCELAFITGCRAHGANSMSSWPSSLPAHFRSPPEEEFTINMSGAPCSMQADPGHQLCQFCIASNVMTQLWSVVCGVTTKNQVSSQDILERMQLVDVAKVLRTRRLRWHGHEEHIDGWLEKVQRLNPTGGRGQGRPKKTWTELIGKECLALGLAGNHPFYKKAWSGRLRSAIRLDLPLN